MTPPPALRALAARWHALNPREQTLLRSAAFLSGLALLWWLALAPALGTLRQAENQHQALETQWQQMQGLQAEARALQAEPRIGHDDALRALETSVRQSLGASAQLQVTGDRATLSLRSVPAGALAQWLAQARVNARAIPAEARLTRSPATAAAGPASWDGTLVLNLPAR
jgi:general secretion pathway protein M